MVKELQRKNEYSTPDFVHKRILVDMITAIWVDNLDALL